MINDIPHKNLQDKKAEGNEGRPSDFVDDLTFGQKLRLTWRGKTGVGRIAGTVLDIAELLPIKGEVIKRLRNRLRGKHMDKPKLMSKTVWSAILIALTAILQALGVDLVGDPEAMGTIYQVIYYLAGAFGLYGLRDAVGQAKKKLDEK